MLVFEDDFFLGETRDGFYIEPMMKRAWAAQLEVLDAIARVCSKYHIRWFADWGTLLGAVRHQGFIPWDDDMDICMLRKDYERFLEVAPGELPEGYFVFSLYSREDWTLLPARVINSMSISYDAERLRQFHGCPYIIGIDIFPLDALPESPTEEENQKLLIKTLLDSAQHCPDDLDEILPLLPDLESLSGVQIDRGKNIGNQLLRAADHVCRKYNKKKPDTITLMPVNARRIRRTYHLKYEWYRTTEYLDFENVVLPCPGNYEEVLTVMYGDWKTPKRGKSSHDYPFYNKQKEALKEELATRVMRGELL